MIQRCYIMASLSSASVPVSAYKLVEKRHKKYQTEAEAIDCIDFDRWEDFQQHLFLDNNAVTVSTSLKSASNIGAAAAQAQPFQVFGFRQYEGLHVLNRYSPVVSQQALDTNCVLQARIGGDAAGTCALCPHLRTRAAQHHQSDHVWRR